MAETEVINGLCKNSQNDKIYHINNIFYPNQSRNKRYNSETDSLNVDDLEDFKVLTGI